MQRKVLTGAAREDLKSLISDFVWILMQIDSLKGSKWKSQVKEFLPIIKGLIKSRIIVTMWDTRGYCRE